MRLKSPLAFLPIRQVGVQEEFEDAAWPDPLIGTVSKKTAFIEHFGTMRERLASLTWQYRHAVRRVSLPEAGM